MDDSVAILWDIENVTPRSDSLFVNGLIEYADGLGKISIATAYGDWTKPSIKKTADALAENSFELIHVPKSKKNSTDIMLSTHAVELIHQYPHIRILILVAGDADFRPLLLSLRKHGLIINIICDAQSASEDLLVLADDYKDYRDLIPDADEDDNLPSRDVKTGFSLEDAFSLLREAISIMAAQKKTTTMGAVKVRMKLLNENFDEGRLGFKTWKKFVLKAAEEGHITIDQTEKDFLLSLKGVQDAGAYEESLPEGIRELLRSISAVSAVKKTAWVTFSAVSNHLIERDVDTKKLGYNKFKKLIQAAEKRNLVETKNINERWSVRMKNSGGPI
ncbi:MAG: NYN domain-containing protein [Spirochaetales bacterium]|nr:NYN domain-containing protein [Spirochaetales bacterium]